MKLKYVFSGILCLTIHTYSNCQTDSSMEDKPIMQHVSSTQIPATGAHQEGG